MQNMDNKQISRRSLFTAAKAALSLSSSPATGTFVSRVAVQTASIKSPLIDENGYTPIPHFYRQQLQSIPQITSVYWALRIYGLVENTQTLNYEDLLRLSSTHVAATLSCISGGRQNPMIGHALWTGIPLSTLLEQVKPTSNAIYAQFYSTDGYTTYLETEKLSQAILAYQMNGETLPREHGYPVRLIVPGLYDYKMPKWIQRIEFTDTPQPGFWERRGWSTTGEVQTMSAILSPYHQETIRGVVQMNGIAYAGNKTIEKIEISINDAPWMPIPFNTSAVNTWTPWQTEWKPPTPGDYLIKVRAHDDQGFTQADRAPAFPNGPTAIQSIVVSVTA
jgi:DMSO/TMAO reductase YedYZ molybdopterin-dependent catalytic subunit